MSAKLPTLISLQEACAIAHCSRAAYYRASKKGTLPRPIVLTGPALVNRDQLIEAIQARIEFSKSRPLREWRRRREAA